MKERLLDVIKWGLIVIIGAIAFYIVCPKYEFDRSTVRVSRANEITGKIELLDKGKWKNVEGRLTKKIGKPSKERRGKRE